MAFGAFVERGATQRHALVNGAAITNLGGLAHHHPHRMVKKHPLANACAGMDFYASQKPGNVRDKAPQPLEILLPAPVGWPVQEHRMQARVTGDDLPAAAGRRVAVKNALNVGADSGKHIFKFIPARTFTLQAAGQAGQVGAYWPCREPGLGFLLET